MSVSSGFFNSIGGDRRYDADKISSIFDGIINDGVYATIGEAFAVKISAGNNLTVGSGRAWFNHRWLLNDAMLPLSLEESEMLDNRYDAIVIEIDNSDSVRSGSIKIVTGEPASSPSKPSMINTTDVHQYPIAYVYRKGGSNEVVQSDIEYTVGSSECPFVTGILKVLDIENIVAQWQAQWIEWFSERKEDGEAEMSQWTKEMQQEFMKWFDGIKDVVGDLDNGELLLQVKELLEEMYGSYATDYDIDQIINGTYVNDDETTTIFDVATEQDIDDIIAGSYEEEPETEPDPDPDPGTGEVATDSDIQGIIEDLFE